MDIKCLVFLGVDLFSYHSYKKMHTIKPAYLCLRVNPCVNSINPPSVLMYLFQLFFLSQKAVGQQCRILYDEIEEIFAKEWKKGEGKELKKKGIIVASSRASQWVNRRWEWKNTLERGGGHQQSHIFSNTEKEVCMNRQNLLMKPGFSR